MDNDTLDTLFRLLLIISLSFTCFVMISETYYAKMITNTIPNEIIVIDVRSSTEYSISHINNSISIPYSCSGCFDNHVRSLKSKNPFIIVYGERSNEAQKRMFELGLSLVYDLQSWRSFLDE
jgi:rhodanese-related sulfurtransferase